MSKNTIVYQHTDGRIFRLKVVPACVSGMAEVTISEVVGHFKHYRATKTFTVAKYDTIVAGAMCCLYGYLAENAEADEVAKKWQEFERSA